MMFQNTAMRPNLLDLPIHREHRDAVMTAFLTLATQAGLVTEFALPEELEVAPRYTP